MKRIATFALASALGWVASSCGTPEVSQILLLIEADPRVRAEAQSLEVQIDGGERPTSFQLADQLTLEASQSQWPRIIALAPKKDDPARYFRVVARASRSGVDGVGETFVQAALIGTYVRGETRTLTLRLEDSCVDVVCGANDHCASMVCREPPIVEPNPVDMGPRASDMGMPQSCTENQDCDDDIACTVDSCDDGACLNRPDATLCPESTNQCERAICGLAGCGVEARSGSCDNGSYCDGADQCSAGACITTGPPPCIGSTVCQEDTDTCVGCASMSDCSDGSVCVSGTCTCGSTSEDCTTAGDEDCNGLADCADPACESVCRDMGAPDMGTDLGTPDMGPDLGTPDMGTDLGTPDMGPADSGTTDMITPVDTDMRVGTADMSTSLFDASIGRLDASVSNDLDASAAPAR